MEAEAEKLKVLQSEVEKQMHMGDAAGKEEILSIIYVYSKRLNVLMISKNLKTVKITEIRNFCD